MAITVRELKEKAKEQIETIKRGLVDAEDITEIRRLQSDARAFSMLIEWIDAPDPAKTIVSDGPGY